MPLLVWANFVLLVVIATPFIAASQFFILLDRSLGFNFFNAGAGGDVLMYQGASFVVLLAPCRLHHDLARLRDHLRNRLPPGEVAQAEDLRLPHDGLLAAGDRPCSGSPSGAPHVHSRHGRPQNPDGDHDRDHRRGDCPWLATLWRGVLHLDTARCCSRLASSPLDLGGISGIMLAMIPFDIHVSASYFIVAHIHYVLFGGSLMTIFAAVSTGSRR